MNISAKTAYLLVFGAGLGIIGLYIFEKVTAVAQQNAAPNINQMMEQLAK